MATEGGPGRQGGDADGGLGAPGRFGERRRRPPRHRTGKPRQGPKGLGQQGGLRDGQRDIVSLDTELNVTHPTRVENVLLTRQSLDVTAVTRK